jgi:hypothetical protein
MMNDESAAKNALPGPSQCTLIGILRLRLIFALTARKDQSSLRMTFLWNTYTK